MMKYLSTNQIAKMWNISERSVRLYCAQGRVVGALLKGKTWMIPADSMKPKRQNRHHLKNETLLQILTREMESKVSGGIYHKLQIEMTYNSNHMEGSSLTHDQTRAIFETRSLLAGNKNANVDDVIETSNHFRCVDLAIQSAKRKLTESLIKQFHYLLKYGTHDASSSWLKVGDYKMYENEVGGTLTISPVHVQEEMQKLLEQYNCIKDVSVYDIIDFHQRFEIIHPFQDGNGRVGRLIMLKECLKHNIIPILITDENKEFYYRGLKEYYHEKGYLIDTCLNGQDMMEQYLRALKII